MKTLNDLQSIYPREKDGWCCVGDYQPMLNSFGEIILQVDDKDYQGDSRVLYKMDGLIGYLQFGWGSCSGCDALQACNSIEDALKLCNELEGQIKWLPKNEMLNFFVTHDWKGDYSWHEDEQRRFINEALEILAKE